FTRDIFRNLVLPVLLPVLAFAFSTNAMGSELREGTATNIVLKPIARSAIIAAKYLASVLATLVVLWPAEVMTQLLATHGTGSGTLLAATLGATAVGTAAYCAVG